MKLVMSLAMKYVYSRIIKYLKRVLEKTDLENDTDFENVAINFPSASLSDN